MTEKFLTVPEGITNPNQNIPRPEFLNLASNCSFGFDYKTEVQFVGL